MDPLPFPARARGEFEANLLRSKVFGIIRDKSFFRARITLASGRESDFYFDMKPTMFSPAGSVALSELILERLQSLNIDYVGGLALGAVPLVSTVALCSHGTGKEIPAFFVRKEVKNHGTKRLVEGLASGETLQGRRVAILDDVTTTGGSAMIAVEAARESGADVVLVLSVVDREEGAAGFYREHGIRFECLFRASEFLNG